jgi:hypothetical protein
MAVEIKELVIRAVVHQGGARPAPAAEARSAASARRADEEREAIVEEAVKAVLRILRASKER